MAFVRVRLCAWARGCDASADAACARRAQLADLVAFEAIARQYTAKVVAFAADRRHQVDGSIDAICAKLAFDAHIATDLVLAVAAVMNNTLIILFVGLVAGLLASVLVRGGGFGMLGDIVLGIIGAFVGSWAFHELGWHAPFAGLAGAITVAAVGAVIVLVVLRLIKGGMARR